MLEKKRHCLWHFKTKSLGNESFWHRPEHPRLLCLQPHCDKNWSKIIHSYTKNLHHSFSSSTSVRIYKPVRVRRRFLGAQSLRLPCVSPQWTHTSFLKRTLMIRLISLSHDSHPQRTHHFFFWNWNLSRVLKLWEQTWGVPIQISRSQEGHLWQHNSLRISPSSFDLLGSRFHMNKTTFTSQAHWKDCSL